MNTFALRLIIFLAWSMSSVCYAESNGSEIPASPQETTEDQVAQLPAFENKTSEVLETQGIENENALNVSIGYDFNTGKYGTQDSITYRTIPLEVSIENNQYALGVMVPYEYLTSPAGSLSVKDAVYVSNANASPQLQTQEGIGDAWLSSTYYLLKEKEEDPLFDLKVQLKIPTADSNKGLGTGKTDVSVQIDRTLRGESHYSMAAVGYLVVGKTSEVTLRDAWFGYFDIGINPSDRSSIGMQLYLQQSIVEQMADVEQITAYFDFKKRPDSNLTTRIYLLTGLTSGSPDFGMGVSGTFEF